MNKNAIVELFINDDSIEKYVMGLNDVSKHLAELISINGFIDDFTKKETFCGLPIIKSQDIPASAVVISCSLAIWPVTVSKLLSTHKVKHVSILDLINDGRLDIRVPYLESFRLDYKNNIEFYDLLRQKLQDEKSKILLDDIISFRVHGNLGVMDKYEVNVKTQYFEDFLNFVDGSIFVDVGGFDGATSIEFIKRCPNYGHVYVLEPSEINFKSVEINLSSYKNVTVIKKGLSNKNQKLSFSDHLGSRSGVTKEGNVEIEVDMLDNLVKDRTNFIKMDIEGGESDAIAGASQTILDDHPILAISVYHKPTDIRKIFEQINSLRKDYNVFLRHYTEGTDETVMFFIPVE